ncbi:MAG: Bcr/CflA family drug resistance efflux transporter [Frankiales bacterium]|nr:Bcr/CflA family drug resistance efflux transporter [Frankiales bacterium]
MADRILARDGAGTVKPERIPARMLLIVGSLSAFGPLCIDMYLPALPDIGDDLHTSASAVQVSLTACLVGLAVGQMIVGPLSDRWGRRRPLFFGLAAFVIASLCCALSPNIMTLIGLRFVQGFGGAAGIVVSRAIVRDQYSGTAAARFFSMLMLVTGAGPILAPQIGAGVLQLGSWRFLFLALAVAGSVLIAIAAVRLPETLPVEERSAGGVAATLRAMRVVATDRNFLVNALACSLAFGAIFAYVAGSSFALENVYGLSPQMFSLAFALNAVGMISASQVNGYLVARIGSARLLTYGLIGLSSAGAVLLVFVSTNHFGLAGIISCMFVLLTSLGFIGPNATALALNDFPDSAGSASALLGMVQFGTGAAVAPLVGLGGTHDVLPMAIVMAACSGSAISVRLLFKPKNEPAKLKDCNIVTATVVANEIL